jgi:hypothetical protein
MAMLANDRRRDSTAEYGDVEVVPRQEFVRDFGQEYASGQHVTKLGPTQRGKSTLTAQLLMTCANRDRQALVLHGKIKGRDPVMVRMANQLDMRIISAYPPNWRWRDGSSRGFILLPLTNTTESVDAENAILAREFRKGIHSNYQNTKRDTITVVDESHQAQETLKLKKDIEGPLMRGAPNAAVWNNIQRGRFVSYHCYDAPEHIFIFYDPDISNQKRYAEIGGVDPQYILQITRGLQRKTVSTNGGRNKATVSECLYIRRGGPELMVVSFD